MSSRNVCVIEIFENGRGKKAMGDLCPNRGIVHSSDCFVRIQPTCI